MSDAPGGPGLRDHLHLLGRFLRNPRTVGAVAPSSAALARQMVAGLDLQRARAVELGPGTGSFTRAIVPKIGPAARFLAIDVDPTFIETLRARWPRVDFVCGSAEQLPTLAGERGLSPVDHILSGLPFASLPAAITRGILDGIERTLRPGGTFTTFQYVNAYSMAAAVAFRQDLSRRLGGEPTRQLVMRNLPPAWVLRWTKTTASTSDNRESAIEESVNR